MSTSEIRPASFDQITTGRNGRMVQIDNDVQGVANGLHEIDPHIRLRYSERGEYFVVYYLPDNLEEGDGYLIFTAQDLDQRIVSHMREIHHRCLQPGYSFAKELDDVEDRKKAEGEYEKSQEMGELHERLAHAMRETAHYNQRKIFVGDGIPT